MTDKSTYKIVGQKTPRVDGQVLVKGKPVFTDDIPFSGLYVKILHSPVAHAKIRKIDIRRALALPGVECVLTFEDFTPHYYTTAGQGYPEPSPRDFRILDDTVRYVGDRVAVVAAETEAIAEKALQLIEVDYEELPAVFDPEEALTGTVVIHPEEGPTMVADKTRNIAAMIEEDLGDVDQAFTEAAYHFEGTYSTPYVQQAHVEPHVTHTWLDEQDRLVIRTATQVPYHVRRIVAEVLGLPVSRIRVIKPRIGGGFGGKQEILNEEICAAITLKTGRPARIMYTREEEFTAARSRHPQKIRLRMALDSDHHITAIDLHILQNSGAYGPHALTVMSVTAGKTLSLYRCPNLRIRAYSVYTNLPPAGAYRGYGAPQGFFALESLVDEIAAKLKVDPLDFRQKNVFQVGDEIPIAKVLGEGREGYPIILKTSGIKECLTQGAQLADWEHLRTSSSSEPMKRGIGVAAVAQGSGIAGIDMASAYIKMNEDGSFHLNVGATDLGTGSDTALTQIAAEVLQVPMEKILIYSSDTDMTPFDTGAYASSTTFISGGAVKKAAELVKRQILDQGKRLLECDDVSLGFQEVRGSNGRVLSYSELCTRSFYTDHQTQIQAVASHLSYDSPPPFNATFAIVDVDTRTGFVTVRKIVSVTDAGQVINPQMAEGQVEGAIPQSLGMTLTEFMIFDARGRAINRDFKHYHVYKAKDMPEIVTRFIHSDEPAGPFGAKAVAEIPINGPAPAVCNAIYNACGVRIRDLPVTPEKILRGLGKIP